MTSPDVDPQASSLAFTAFLRYISYLISRDKGYHPIIIILEQHYHRCTPRGALRPCVVNHRLRHWHFLLEQWAAPYHDVYFVRTFGLNGHGWTLELCDGVHLNAMAMATYVRIIQHAMFVAEHLLASKYSVLHIFQMLKHTSATSRQAATVSRPRRTTPSVYRKPPPESQSQHESQAVATLQAELASLCNKLAQLQQTPLPHGSGEPRAEHTSLQESLTTSQSSINHGQAAEILLDSPAASFPAPPTTISDATGGTSASHTTLPSHMRLSKVPSSVMPILPMPVSTYSQPTAAIPLIDFFLLAI